MTHPAEAQQFCHQGIAEFDRLLIGEREAKLGMITAMVMGENILLFGPPGGGKTTLARDSYRLVEGINPGDVATIPAMADLRPEQLIGGQAVSTKETKSGDESYTETIKATIDSIIGEETKVIFANEINRVNPFALNGALEALESGVIDTSAGTITLKGLEYVVSTMNPSEGRSGTFPMTAAMASRHSLGAMLGAIGENRGHVISEITMGTGWEPKPEDLRPVIDLSGLQDLRADIPRMPIPEDLRGRTVELVTGTVDVLRDFKKPDIHEADGRMAKQIAKIAKTLAILGAQERVTEQDLVQAVKYVLAARLGALSAHAAQEIQNVHKSIVE